MATKKTKKKSTKKTTKRASSKAKGSAKPTSDSPQESIEVLPDSPLAKHVTGKFYNMPKDAPADAARGIRYLAHPFADTAHPKAQAAISYLTGKK